MGRVTIIAFALVFPLTSMAGYPEYKEGYQSGWVGAYLDAGKSKPIRVSTPVMPPRKANDKRPDVERGYADGFSDGKEKIKK